MEHVVCDRAGVLYPSRADLREVSQGREKKGGGQLLATHEIEREHYFPFHSKVILTLTFSRIPVLTEYLLCAR